MEEKMVFSIISANLSLCSEHNINELNVTVILLHLSDSDSDTDFD